MISISQWRITGLVAIVLAVMSAGSYVWLGLGEEAIRAMVRGTARSSVLLFVLAFSASSLHTLFNTSWSRWLRQNRRYIGVSFALSHFVHLLFLILLMVHFPEDMFAKLHLVEIILAGLTYVFILAMTITSFDGPRQWLGERGWHILHATGMYLIWLIFVETYSFAAWHNPAYLPLVIMLLAAMGLRIAKGIKTKRDPLNTP